MRIFYFSFLKIYLCLERGKSRERNINQYVVASCARPLPEGWGELACDPGIGSDLELNQRPFGLQARAQTTELHQPGLFQFYLSCFIV